MAKIYVVAKGAHEYSSAETYGEVVFLYDDDRKANVFATDALIKEIEEKLKDATADDYLIMSGSMLPSAVAFSVLLEKTGVVNNLLFSFRNSNYELRTVRATQFAAVGEVLGSEELT